MRQAIYADMFRLCGFEISVTRRRLSGALNVDFKFLCLASLSNTLTLMRMHQREWLSVKCRRCLELYDICRAFMYSRCDFKSPWTLGGGLQRYICIHTHIYIHMLRTCGAIREHDEAHQSIPQKQQWNQTVIRSFLPIIT